MAFSHPIGGIRTPPEPLNRSQKGRYILRTQFGDLLFQKRDRSGDHRLILTRLMTIGINRGNMMLIVPWRVETLMKWREPVMPAPVEDDP